MKIKKLKLEKVKKLSKKKKRLIIAAAALLVLILAACYTLFIAPLLKKEEWVYKEETVERGTLKVGVTESGSLSYTEKSIDYDLDLSLITDSDDDSDSSDSDDEEEEIKYLEVETVTAVAGSRVTSGDELLKFTDESVERVRSLIKNALLEAEADYIEAESTYEISALEAQTTLDTSEISAKYASKIKSTSLSAISDEISSISVSIAEKEAQVTSLNEAYEDALEDYEDVLETYTDAKEQYEATSTSNSMSFVTVQKAYLNAKNSYEQASEKLERAKQAITDNEEEIASLKEKLTQATLKKKLKNLEITEEYDEAVISGENAELTYQASLEDLEDTLNESLEKKEELEDLLESFEALVGDDGIIVATEDGIITESAYEEGDSLTATGAMFKYATSDNLIISVDVTQEDIVDLNVGDSVDITFTAYSDETYTGTISSINTEAVSDYSNTISYTVEILVDGDIGKLYSGMTAEVVFVTEEKEDVLYVSRKAIVEEDGKTYVYHKNSLGIRELTEVTTGLTNGTDIEILSGLSEGETIYLASKVSSESEVNDSEVDETETSSENSEMTFDADSFSGGDMPDMQGGDFGGGNFGGGDMTPPGGR